MIPRRYGRIINIASIAALVGSSGDFKALHTCEQRWSGQPDPGLGREWGVHGDRRQCNLPRFYSLENEPRMCSASLARRDRRTPLRQLGTEDDMKGLVVLLAGAERAISAARFLPWTAVSPRCEAATRT